MSMRGMCPKSQARTEKNDGREGRRRPKRRTEGDGGKSVEKNIYTYVLYYKRA